MHSSGLRVFLSLGAVAFSIATFAAPPEVSFGPNGVTVRGVSPGSRVAWMAVVREPVDNHNGVRVIRGVTPVTPSGIVPIPSKKFELTRALWIVSDVETGGATRIATPGYETSTRLTAVTAVAGQSVVTITSAQAQVLYVRPTIGAWFTDGYDGGYHDSDDKADGKMQLALSAFKPLHQGGSAALVNVAAGDIILIIDPVLMRATRIEVLP